MHILRRNLIVVVADIQAVLKYYYILFDSYTISPNKDHRTRKICDGTGQKCGLKAEYQNGPRLNDSIFYLFPCFRLEILCMELVGATVSFISHQELLMVSFVLPSSFAHALCDPYSAQD